jgi:hypothetical protein
VLDTAPRALGADDRLKGNSGCQEAQDTWNRMLQEFYRSRGRLSRSSLWLPLVFSCELLLRCQSPFDPFLLSRL